MASRPPGGRRWVGCSGGARSGRPGHSGRRGRSRPQPRGVEPRTSPDGARRKTSGCGEQGRSSRSLPRQPRPAARCRRSGAGGLPGPVEAPRRGLAGGSSGVLSDCGRPVGFRDRAGRPSARAGPTSSPRWTPQPGADRPGGGQLSPALALEGDGLGYRVPGESLHTGRDGGGEVGGPGTGGNRGFPPRKGDRKRKNALGGIASRAGGR